MNNIPKALLTIVAIAYILKSTSLATLTILNAVFSVRDRERNVLRAEAYLRMDKRHEAEAEERKFDRIARREGL